MQFHFQELYSHIERTQGEKFEDTFIVKIASKGTSLISLFLHLRGRVVTNRRNIKNFVRVTRSLMYTGSISRRFWLIFRLKF